MASASEQFVANLNFASLVKAKELHQRVLFTLCALVVYRLGTFIPIMMDERRPVLITDEPIRVGGVVVIAWDGGRESSRAARRAVAWLQKADQVVVLTAPQAMTRPCEPGPLLSYLSNQGIQAQAMPLHSRGEAAPLILDTVRELGANALVAGAFCHPRLQRFVFGGTTQILLDSAPAAALFLSH